MNFDIEKHAHSLEQLVADLTIENQKLREDYSKMSTDEIDSINKDQLKEMAHFYGSWDKLREVVKQLEENHNEAAFERYFSRDL